MYKYRIIVELNDKGKNLLNKDNYEHVLDIPYIEEHNDPEKLLQYLMNKFTKEIMPHDLFRNFTYEQVARQFEAGEYVNMLVHTNGCGGIYIPMVVNIEEKNGNSFVTLNYIEGFNYTQIMAELYRGAYTHNFDPTRICFNRYTGNRINGDKKSDPSIKLLTENQVNNIKDSIEYNKKVNTIRNYCEAIYDNGLSDRLSNDTLDDLIDILKKAVPDYL